jgi:16S rRNA (cytosine1402-N4)-methyltransferase
MVGATLTGSPPRSSADVTLFHVASAPSGGSAVGGSYHQPVLAQEVLELLSPHAGLYLDGTLGGGGHTRLLLESNAEVRVLGVDRDPEALSEAMVALADFGDRVRVLRARFDDSVSGLSEGERFAGALLDLGVSSHQLDEDARGFTFRTGAVLDMRMDAEADIPTAADLLNESSADELVRIFRDYGEMPRARKLVRQIISRRESLGMRTSDDLVAALRRTTPNAPSTKEKARIFQALRIAVNQEIEALEAALPSIRDALEPEGVLAVISYHSLEDRVVKRAFREWSRSCVCPPELPICVCRGQPLGTTLTRSPVSASDVEIQRNPRARSARLRAWRAA